MRRGASGGHSCCFTSFLDVRIPRVMCHLTVHVLASSFLPAFPIKRLLVGEEAASPAQATALLAPATPAAARVVGLEWLVLRAWHGSHGELLSRLPSFHPHSQAAVGGAQTVCNDPKHTMASAAATAARWALKVLMCGSSFLVLVLLSETSKPSWGGRSELCAFTVVH